MRTTQHPTFAATCWILAATIVLFCSGALGAPQQEQPDAVSRTTVFIGLPSDDPMPTPLGTGFLLSDGTAVCLMTAQHVARRVAPTAVIKLLVGSEPRLLTLRDAAYPGAGWELHTSADVAAHRLRPLSNGSMHVFRRSQILSDELVPMRERPLVVFGFPLGLGVSDFAPISQEFSRASEIVVAKSDAFPVEAQYYLLDRPSIDGYSGAPVFQVPGTFGRGASIVLRRDFILAGVVAGTISDRTGGKLGAVVPPKFVAEVFDRACESQP